MFAFCQHYYPTVAGRFAKLVDGLFPEICRHTIRHVASEPVDATFHDPEKHRVDHRFSHLLVIVVQVSHIIPLPRPWMDDGVGLLIVCVPVGVVFHPWMVPRRVVGHPVEDDAHLVVMANLHQVLKLIDCPKFRRDCLVIPDAVGRILPLFHTNGIYGHHPHHIHTQCSDGVDASSHGIE